MQRESEGGSREVRREGRREGGKEPKLSRVTSYSGIIIINGFEYMYYFRTIILFYYKVNELSLPGCQIRVFLLFQLPVKITDYSSFSFVLVPVVNVI